MKESVREVFSELITFAIAISIGAVSLTIFFVVMIGLGHIFGRKSKPPSVALIVYLFLAIRYFPRMYLKIRKSIRKKMHLEDDNFKP